MSLKVSNHVFGCFLNCRLILNGSMQCALKDEMFAISFCIFDSGCSCHFVCVCVIQCVNVRDEVEFS